MPAPAPSRGDLSVADNGDTLVLQAGCVAIGGRALAIMGTSGSGKSSLALALIDRGARLIGDDGVTLTRTARGIVAGPPPNTSGLIEIRGVGIVTLETAPPTPLALVLLLGEAAERLPEQVPTRELLGVQVPHLPFDPGSIAPAKRAEWALALHGLDCGRT